MVPLGWVGGVIDLIVATAISLYANILVARIHEVGGKRHIRYKNLPGFIYGKRAYALTWALQYVNLFMINVGYLILAGVNEILEVSDAHDVLSLLSSPTRDYLIHNSSDQVKIDGLKGKTVGLYFSASCCGPCHRFTPKLVDVYNDVSAKGGFEVVYVSADEDVESFNEYFSKMPWVVVPFPDADTRNQLNDLFNVSGYPFTPQHDKVLSDEGVLLIGDYEEEWYPFTPQHLKELNEQ